MDSALNELEKSSMDRKTISVLVDNESWILPFAAELTSQLQQRGWNTRLVRDSQNVETGWVNFMLGCTRLVSAEILARNTHNLVIHESALPAGRGFAPVAWQILEGCKEIPVCLIEATETADDGRIWLQDCLLLDGTELSSEWREKQGRKSVEMCLKFVEAYDDLNPRDQVGEPSWYSRRRPKDSELDVNRSIAEQFELLRIVDNERYPAFFELNGQKFILKIYSAGDS